MTESIQRLADEASDLGLVVQQLRGALSALEDVTASDEKRVIYVTVSGACKTLQIELRNSWARYYTEETLPAVIKLVNAQAATLVLDRMASAFGMDNDPSKMEAIAPRHTETVDRINELFRVGSKEEQYRLLSRMDSLLRDVNSWYDDMMSALPTEMSDEKVTGLSGVGHVKVHLNRDGFLQGVELVQGWAKRNPVSSVNREIADALGSAVDQCGQIGPELPKNPLGDLSEESIGIYLGIWGD